MAGELGRTRMMGRGGVGAMAEPISLTGIVLPDARTGRLVDLGQEPAFGLVTLIRHRF